MGSPGQSSVQITFKVNKNLREKIERERELSGGTLSEFLNDAVKHYINYLEDKRYNEIKYLKYCEDQEADNMEPQSLK